MRPSRLSLAGLLAALTLLAAPAVAAQASVGTMAPTPREIEDLYTGWRASAVLDTPVHGKDDRPLGQTVDLFLSPFNEADLLQVEVPEAMAEGPSRTFVLTWEEAQIGPGLDRIDTELSTERIAEMVEEGEFERLDAPVRDKIGWRVGQLLGAEVVLDGGERLGTVDDLIMDRGAFLKGAVVDANGTLYAVPWESVVVEPGGTLSLPYRRAGLERIEPFDYAKLTGDLAYEG